ncbi:hypothetical protein RRG08_048651 [Elysia crispata]|uniref:Uncharacterized protein n=1 Tax=Elysia crispata TaxID=231223 RepID=A0AAE1AF34_9GAST|nr:hypothetical protein RRG08_048651 [Elysia crispata]
MEKKKTFVCRATNSFRLEANPFLDICTQVSAFEISTSLIWRRGPTDRDWTTMGSRPCLAGEWPRRSSQPQGEAGLLVSPVLTPLWSFYQTQHADVQTATRCVHPWGQVLAPWSDSGSPPLVSSSPPNLPWAQA